MDNNVYNSEKGEIKKYRCLFFVIIKMCHEAMKNTEMKKCNRKPCKNINSSLKNKKTKN